MDALKADIKSQKIQGNPVTSNISDVIAKKRGALKAKHTNFDKAYKENERIATIVKNAQDKQDAMTSAHAKQEADALGNLIGSVQHELHPLHRQAIEARAMQLRDLVRNVPSVSQHLDKGLAIQQSFQKIGEDSMRTGEVFAELIRARARTGDQPPRLSVGVPSFAMNSESEASSSGGGGTWRSRVRGSRVPSSVASSSRRQAK